MTIAAIVGGITLNHNVDHIPNPKVNGANSRSPNFVSVVVSPLNSQVARAKIHPHAENELGASQNSTEEDRYLGNRVQLQPGMAGPPPLPPRAPTDPEAHQADNPADFDLPNQDKH